MHRSLAFLFVSAALLVGQPASKYKGPRPAKADLPYLVHATNLVETESGEAREEQRKDEIANIMKGASSPARTPLAEPIFLLNAESLAPEKLELYRTLVKNGQREVNVPKNPKKAKDSPKPVRLSITKLDGTLYRLEATEALDNGEYCLSPSGSNKVFCFQVY